MAVKLLPRTLSAHERDAVRIALTHPVLWDLLQRRADALREEVGNSVLDVTTVLSKIPFHEYRDEARGIQYTTDFLSAVLAACDADPAEG